MIGLPLPELAGYCVPGVLDPADLRVAATLGRVGGESAPEVLLAAALAVRAPRYGHVCVELDEVSDRVIPEGTHGEEPIELPGWPETAAWVEALAASPLVRDGWDADVGDGERDVVSPLVRAGLRVYLDRYWTYERGLGRRLRARATRAIPVNAGVLRDALDRLFPVPESGVDRQRLAAAAVALRGLTVITGPPGTGKTATVARILALLHAVHAGDRPLRVALAAPTGKAAARMDEALRDNIGGFAAQLDPTVADALGDAPQAVTLHRLLGTRADNHSRFLHHADRPLPHDVVIVDEASMVSLPLTAKLADAVRPDARLVLLGDRDQLASVEAGAVLGDICGPEPGDSLRLSRGFADTLGLATNQDVAAEATLVDEPGVWDGIVRLNRFYRFGRDSGIGGVARAIQRGGHDVVAFLRGERTEEGPGRYDDVTLFEPPPDGEASASVRDDIVGPYARVVELVAGGTDPAEVLAAMQGLRVLCALRGGPDGVSAWNERVEAWLAEAVHGVEIGQRWYPGRPVLVTENDYSVRLFNGDVGVVVEVDGQRRVAFEDAGGGARLLSPARLPAHETTWAMTIHKAQGSQFAHAIVVLPGQPSPILTRELLYTAITRARKRATVIATEPILGETLSRPVQRASGLMKELWDGPRSMSRVGFCDGSNLPLTSDVRSPTFGGESG